MNPLQLYTEVCGRTLSVAESDRLQQLADRYPFFAVLHFIKAKHASLSNDSHAESLRTVAAIYAPDRKKLASYLTEGFKMPENGIINMKQIPSEVIVSSNETNKEQQQIVKEIRQITEPTVTVHEPEARTDPGMNWKINTLVQIMLDRTRYLIESVPLEIKTYVMTRDASEQDIIQIAPASPALELLRTTLDEQKHTENDVKAVVPAPTEHPVSVTSSKTLEPRSRSLEDDIKARIARAKELLHSGEKSGMSNAPLSEGLPVTEEKVDKTVSSEKVTVYPETIKDEAVINEGKISDNILFTDADASSNPSNEGQKLTSGFLERFVFPKFDPKPETLYAYRVFLDPGDGISISALENEENESVGQMISSDEIPIAPPESIRKVEHTGYRKPDEQKKIIERVMQEVSNERSEVPFEPVKKSKKINPDAVRSWIIEDFSVFSGTYEVPTNSETGMIEKTHTSSFQRFIPPVFDPKPESLHAYRLYLDPATQDIIADPPVKLSSDSFSRFIVPVFDPKSPTLTVREYRVSDVINTPVADLSRADTIPFESGLPRMVEGNTERFEVAVSNPTEVAFLESKAHSDTIKEESNTYLPIQMERITSNTFRRFRSLENEKVIPQSFLDNQKEANTHTPTSERITNESMKRFVEPDFSDIRTESTSTTSPTGTAEKINVSSPLTENIETRPTAVEENEIITPPPSTAVEMIGSGVHQEQDNSRGPALTTETEQQSSERIRNESMNRFVEPEFGTARKSMTYDSKREENSTTELQHPEHTEAVQLDAVTKGEGISVPPVPEETPASISGVGTRIFNEPMTRFVEPEFEGKVKQMNYSAAENPISESPSPTVAPTPESSVIEVEVTKPQTIEAVNQEINDRLRNESMTRFVEPDFGERLLKDELESQKTGIPISQSEQEPASQPSESKTERVRTESMDRFVEPQFDPKPETLHLDRETKEQPLIESQSSQSMDRFVEPQFDPKPKTLHLDRETKEQPLTETQSSPSETIILPTPDIQETVIRYPHKGMALEIKLRPDQLKMFSIDVHQLTQKLQAESQHLHPIGSEQEKPIVSPELIEQEFFASLEGQNAGNLNLDKVIIDYSKKMIEFVVEDAVPAPEPVVQIVEVEKIVEVPVDRIVEVEKVVEVPVDRIVEVEKVVEVPVDRIVEVEKVVQTDTPIFAVEPLQIRNLVLDYNLFLEQALAIKETFSENEAEKLFRLIYEKLEKLNPDFVYQTFGIPAPLPEGQVGTLFTKEILERTGNLASDTWTERRMSDDYESSGSNIDERISRFRNNLARIRNKTMPDAPSVTLNTIQDRFIESIITTMTRPGVEGENFSLDEFLKSEGTLEPAGSSPIDEVINQYKSLETKIYSNIESGSKTVGYEDFQIDLPEEEEKEIPPNIATESMAKILTQQGKIEQAVEIYRRLMLKFPNKKAYFEAQIQNLS